MRGFWLIELIVVIAVASVALQGYYLWKRAEAWDRVVQGTVDAVLSIDEAALAFRDDNPGVWPGTISVALGSGGYMPAAGAARLVGRGFRIATGATGLLEIEVGMATDALAEAVASAFGSSGTATGSQVVVAVPIPGHELEHSSLVRRDGTAVLTRAAMKLDGNDVLAGGGSIAMQGGGVDVDGGDINGAVRIAADRVEDTAPATVGGPCPVGAMGVDRDGKPVSCVGGAWRGFYEPCHLVAGASYTTRHEEYHWLFLVTTCGSEAGIGFEGSNA